MDKTDLEKAMDKAIKVKLEAVDKLIEELIEPLEKLGSPEALIGKSYEMWDGQDFQLLASIYGQGDNTPLSNLVFKKEYEKVLQLEENETR